MSAFNTPWFNNQDRSFFNSLNKSKIAHVILSAETEDFADEVSQQWQAAGFHVVYVPLLGGGNDYVNRVKATGDSMGASEQYAVVAYGDAASLILQSHTKPNTPKICAIVAYYPSAIPPVTTKYPGSIRVLVHLAGNEISVKSNHEVLGIQSSKKKTVRKRIDPGAGAGGCLKLGFKAYTYAAEPGFAEHDLEEFDAVAEGLAFSRSLSVVKKAFRIEEDLDTMRDELADLADEGSTEKLLHRTSQYAHVINAPTLVGGAGAKALKEFYDELFEPLPDPYKKILVSRTESADRVVDELFLSFTHSCEMPWLLPSIPATGKTIEMALVSIVCLRGGKLESEHVYWDQASVLLQAGLLDPKVVPEAMKKNGVKRLPVVGAESARAVKRGSSREMNRLL